MCFHFRKEKGRSKFTKISVPFDWLIDWIMILWNLTLTYSFLDNNMHNHKPLSLNIVVLPFHAV